MGRIERLEKYCHANEPFDDILRDIQKGVIKCGKYSHLVKIRKNWKLNPKEMFPDDRSKDDKSK